TSGRGIKESVAHSVTDVFTGTGAGACEADFIPLLCLETKDKNEYSTTLAPSILNNSGVRAFDATSILLGQIRFCRPMLLRATLLRLLAMNNRQ
ncbi:MAG: hypothetical protein LBI18_15900, partial [Planctomycetaceae bacterium]|nr:hypothetical protein [Planctomycetaceae bacterium]